MIQSQCESLERESIAERNLLQAQERLKAIRTMRKRVLAGMGDQSQTSIDTPPPDTDTSVMNHASTSNSPVINAEPEEAPNNPTDEVKKLDVLHPIISSTLLGPQNTCSEPDILPSSALEPRPQSVPANHRFADTKTYTYSHFSQPLFEPAQGYIRSPDSKSPEVTARRCTSEPPLQMDTELDCYTSRSLLFAFM
jgi:hypothetical protein